LNSATVGSAWGKRLPLAVGVYQHASRDINSLEPHGAIETLGISDDFAAEGDGFAEL
jgi:hypothetical protein